MKLPAFAMRSLKIFAKRERPSYLKFVKKISMNNHVMKEKKMLFVFAIYCLQILAGKKIKNLLCVKICFYIAKKASLSLLPIFRWLQQ